MSPQCHRVAGQVRSGAAIALAMMALAALTATLRAQVSIGAGNALDRNPGVGTGGRNIRTPAMDFSGRNLLITGDVVGGRGFRGSVGYSAAGDFTAPLGSNDLYQFRALSAGTGVPFFDMARTVEPLRFGQDLGVAEFHRSGFSKPLDPATGSTTPAERGGTYLSPMTAPLRSAAPLDYSFIDAQARLDQILNAVSSASATGPGATPNLVGRVQRADGTVVAADASSLRGLRYLPPEVAGQLVGLSTMDLVRTLDDLSTGRVKESAMGRPWDASFTRTLADTRIAPGPDETPRPEPGPADPRIRPEHTTYLDIMQRIAQRYAQTDVERREVEPRLLKQLDQDFMSLRNRLMTGRQEPTAEPELGAALPGEKPIEPGQEGAAEGPSGERIVPQPDLGSTLGKPQLLKPTLPRLVDPSELAKPTPLSTVRQRLEELRRREGERDPVPTIPSLIDVRDFGQILRHGEQLDRLSGADSTRLNELMRAAELKMTEGEYFMAERRFTRALRYTPGHPLALGGIVNAQLGAGLHLSASVTFRSLATHHPEMIDVRYSPDLLPWPEHIDRAVQAMRQRIAGERTRDDDRASCGLMLAYVGHQRRDRALIEEGLGIVRRHSPDDQLLPLLEAVWLGAGAEMPPAKQPAAPPPGAPDK